MVPVGEWVGRHQAFEAGERGWVGASGSTELLSHLMGNQTLQL